MADSSATVIIIFVIFLLMAGGGTAAWYFLYYKPRQGPSPAPAYVSAPIVYTTTPPSIPSPTTDGDGGDGDGGDGEDDYDPIELGEVVSPAGSPSAKFSIVLWRAKMKKKFGKNRTILQKRLKVLEKARDADQEMSGTVPSEHFDAAIAYIKTLIKTLPKAPAPRVSTKKPPTAKKFNLAAWKVRAKNELKGKRPAVITARIDRLKDAQTKKLSIKDGVPRAQYNEAIKWLRVLEKEAKKPEAKAKTTSKKFNLAAWKTATQKKLKNKSKQEIQRAITRFENSTAAVHDGVPKASKGQAITFLKGLKAKAKR